MAARQTNRSRYEVEKESENVSSLIPLQVGVTKLLEVRNFDEKPDRPWILLKVP